MTILLLLRSMVPAENTKLPAMVAVEAKVAVPEALFMVKLLKELAVWLMLWAPVPLKVKVDVPWLKVPAVIAQFAETLMAEDPALKVELAPFWV